MLMRIFLPQRLGRRIVGPKHVGRVWDGGVVDYDSSDCRPRWSGWRVTLRGNPLLGRNLQLAKCMRVSGAILSLPGSPPVSLRIRRVLMAKAIRTLHPGSGYRSDPHASTHQPDRRGLTLLH